MPVRDNWGLFRPWGPQMPSELAWFLWSASEWVEMCAVIKSLQDERLRFPVDVRIISTD